ncbi:MAG: hypothetical protein Q8R91_04270 [Candidatus Omnitrophota bacterium]|nr:hypothetical protein [Candidatus Omnitrophota bacterium]
MTSTMWHPMEFLSVLVSRHGLFDEPVGGFKILAAVSKPERDKLILLTEVEGKEYVMELLLSHTIAFNARTSQSYPELTGYLVE